MVTVTVEATWRMSRAEFNLPYLEGESALKQTVIGFGEVLLQESGEPAPIMRNGRMAGPEVKTYGAMPGASVMRDVDVVKEETVEVDGTSITFGSLLEGLGLFFERWRTEDSIAVNPMGVPPAAKTTEVFHMPPPAIPTPPTEPEPK
jgi:hypothetical protein